jgi:hypothetical protein
VRIGRASALSTRASASAAVQFGRRRSLSLTGVTGWKTSAALIARGAPIVESYSSISGSGSTPTARPMLRIWPRA